jgi:hypothetical protein
MATGSDRRGFIGKVHTCATGICAISASDDVIFGSTTTSHHHLKYDLNRADILLGLYAYFNMGRHYKNVVQVTWLPEVTEGGSLERCTHAQPEFAQYPPYLGLFTGSDVSHVNPKWVFVEILQLLSQTAAFEMQRYLFSEYMTLLNISFSSIFSNRNV